MPDGDRQSNAEPKLMDRMTDRSRNVLRLSAAFSRQFAHVDIEPQDLLDALAHLDGVSDAVLVRQGYAKKSPPPPLADADRLLDAAKLLQPIVAEAHNQATLLGHGYVGTEHLLLALLLTNPELTPDPRETRLSVLQILGHAAY